jgi:Tol biopolymer transport system component
LTRIAVVVGAAALSTACGDSDETLPSLVDIRPATATECTAGGQTVLVGSDTNGNGTLDESEVTNSSAVCNGSDGMDGAPGADGMNGDPGEDGDDGLPGDPGMNGVPGTNALIATTTIAPGADCANGGTQVDAGLDDDNDGVLDEGEIDATSFICTGEDGDPGQPGQPGQDGATALVRTSTPAADATCGTIGGIVIESGIDDDDDGVLEDPEVDDTQVICNGADGQDGTDGQDGSNGQDGQDGTDGLNPLVNVVAEPPGANCPAGGQRIDIGVDLNRNGTFEGNEVVQQVFVCNAIAQVPFAILTSTTVPDAIVNQPYSLQLEAAGGTNGNYSWSISAGALPNGLAIDPTGTPSTNITGSPTQAGTFTFTVQVEDFFGQTATQDFSLFVAAPLLEITTFVVPRVDTAVAYNFQLQTVGGQGPFTWSVLSGALPAGVSLSAGGLITGTPTSPVGSTVIVQVGDSLGGTQRARLKFNNTPRNYAAAGTFNPSLDQELFFSDFTSGTPSVGVPLNPVPVTGGDLGQTTTASFFDARYASSGTKIAFVGDFQLDGAEEIFFTDVSGTTPGATIQGNPTFTLTDQDVDADTYGWSPDGRWLAFVADDVTNSEFNLFLVDTNSATPTPVQVNGVLPPSADVDTTADVRFSPDSTKLAYISDEIVNDESRLFVVDLTQATPTPVQVSGSGALADVFSFIWSPDSSSLVFVADELADGINELFISNVAGATPTAPVRLSAPFPNPTGDVQTGTSNNEPIDYGFSPDGTRLYYIVDATTEGVDELYVVDVATPGTARQVGPAGLTDGDNDVDLAYWTPDSNSLVFVGELETVGVLEIFLGDASGALGGSFIKLNGNFVASGEVSQGTATFAEVVVDPRGRGVAFMADAFIDGQEELVFVEFGTPGVNVPLSTNIGAGEDVNGFVVAQDGSLVVYNADANATSQDELFGVDTSGALPGAPFLINPPVVTSGDVDTSDGLDYQIVGDGEGVVYIGDVVTDAVDEVFYAPITGGVAGASTSLFPAQSGDADIVYVQP